MSKVLIEGSKILTEKEFYSEFNSAFDIGCYFGENLDALWDFMTTDMKRPILIVWKNHKLSEGKLGLFFYKIINTFDDVKSFDEKLNFDEKFSYSLE